MSDVERTLVGGPLDGDTVTDWPIGTPLRAGVFCLIHPDRPPHIAEAQYDVDGEYIGTTCNAKLLIVGSFAECCSQCAGHYVDPDEWEHGPDGRLVAKALKD